MIAVVFALILLVIGFCGLIAEKMLIPSDEYSEIPSTTGSFRFFNRYWGWGEQACYSIVFVFSVSQLLLSLEYAQGSVGNHASFSLFMLVVLINSTQPLSSTEVVKYFKTTLCSLILAYSLINCYEEYGLLSLLSIIAAVGSLGCHIVATYFSTFVVLDSPPTAEYTCDLFSYLSFSYLNPILIDPASKKIELDFDEIPGLQPIDTSESSWKIFNEYMKKQTNNGAEKDKLNLIVCILHLIWREWLFQGVFHFIQSSTNFLTPLALQRILLYIAGSPQSEAVMPVSVHVAVALLFVSPLLECISENQIERISG